MKHRTTYFVTLILLGCLLGGIGIKSLDRKIRNSEFKESLKDLRNIRVLDLSGKESTIPNKNSVVLIYFNSGCELCQQEVSELRNYFSNHPRYFGAFISRENLDQIKGFMLLYHLDSLKNVSFFKMHPKAFESDLIKQYPQFFIYRSGKLIEEYSGMMTSSGLEEKLQ